MMASHPRRETGTIAAYELYLRGREQWARRKHDRRSARRSNLFERSIREDPAFALAHAGIADAYALTASGLQPQERFPKAKAAALQALDLDEGLADAHTALAFHQLQWEWRWELADGNSIAPSSCSRNHVLARPLVLRVPEHPGPARRRTPGLRQGRASSTLTQWPCAWTKAAALARAGRGEQGGRGLAGRLEARAELRRRCTTASTPRSGRCHAGRGGVRGAAAGARVGRRHARAASREEMRRVFERGGFAALARSDVAELIKGRSRPARPRRPYYSRLSLAGSEFFARQFVDVIGDDGSGPCPGSEEAPTRRHDDGPLAIPDHVLLAALPRRAALSRKSRGRSGCLEKRRQAASAAAAAQQLGQLVAGPPRSPGSSGARGLPPREAARSIAAFSPGTPCPAVTATASGISRSCCRRARARGPPLARPRRAARPGAARSRRREDAARAPRTARR
jgi:hypothetical protein